MSRLRKNDKRVRLIAATYTLIEEKTVHKTTLADIAKHANIPLGNVYYYFKTKDDVVMAAIKHRQTELRTLFESWSILPTATARLHAFIQQMLDNAPRLARFGSLTGALCQELSKLQEVPGFEASTLLRASIDWVTQQFQALGKSAELATVLAENLVSRIEGCCLLCSTFKDPNLCIREAEVLQAWIKTLVAESVTA